MSNVSGDGRPRVKVWRAHGTSHSANLSVVGTFRDEQMATEAAEMIQDFIEGLRGGRYSNVRDWAKKWASRIPEVAMVVAGEGDVLLAQDEVEPSVSREGVTVTVESIHLMEFNALLTMMFVRYATRVTVSGEPGP